MGWIPYPASFNSYPSAGQNAQGQGYSSNQGGYGSTANLQAIAASQMPHTSGLATGLQAIAGLMAGQQQAQAQANQPAAPFNGDASPSLLASLLRNGAPSASSSDDDSGNPQLTGWGAAGQGVGQAAAQAIGRKSDRRLKSNVCRIGTLRNGLPVYSYRLEGSALYEVGCMADEVAQIRADATWFDPVDGFARVDYSKAVL